MARFLRLAVGTICCLLLGTVAVPGVLAQDKKPSSANSDSEKLSRDLSELREEITALRKALQGVDPTQPPVTLRKGTATFPDGKKRDFTGIAGVRDVSNMIPSHQHVRVSGQLVLGKARRGWEKEIPIMDLTRLQIIQKGREWSIEFESKDGKKSVVQFSEDDELFLDIKWTEQLGIDRFGAKELKNVVIAFEK